MGEKMRKCRMCGKLLKNSLKKYCGIKCVEKRKYARVKYLLNNDEGFRSHYATLQAISGKLMILRKKRQALYGIRSRIEIELEKIKKKMDGLMRMIKALEEEKRRFMESEMIQNANRETSSGNCIQNNPFV